ncbi:hypothetical protein MA16_Dca000748 [Dendrobium catenatum]|uniref:Uncharacterized protein n=1 Tax=Dendrobium catenatum TaxID=906689 RepID=A0A2I0WUU6_9ASPA|nr:hypothetical protein MA16_Dca000748 [Dendrobium catenatum]
MRSSISCYQSSFEVSNHSSNTSFINTSFLSLERESLNSLFSRVFFSPPAIAASCRRPSDPPDLNSSVVLLSSIDRPPLEQSSNNTEMLTSRSALQFPKEPLDLQSSPTSDLKGKGLLDPSSSNLRGTGGGMAAEGRWTAQASSIRSPSFVGNTALGVQVIGHKTMDSNQRDFEILRRKSQGPLMIKDVIEEAPRKVIYVEGKGKSIAVEELISMTPKADKAILEVNKIDPFASSSECSILVTSGNKFEILNMENDIMVEDGEKKGKLVDENNLLTNYSVGITTLDKSLAEKEDYCCGKTDSNMTKKNGVNGESTKVRLDKELRWNGISSQKSVRLKLESPGFGSLYMRPKEDGTTRANNSLALASVSQGKAPTARQRSPYKISSTFPDAAESPGPLTPKRSSSLVTFPRDKP